MRSAESFRSRSPEPLLPVNTLTPPETEAILTLSLLAAFADGEKHDREREELRKITSTITADGFDITALYQEVLLRKPDLKVVADRLSTAEARLLAYEMAVCVCDADDVSTELEKDFLHRLREALALSSNTVTPVDTDAEVLVTTPIPTSGPAPAEKIDAMILRYAISGGALELLPQTLGTLAIVPMQVKMVYRIGKEHGVTLDRKSIVEFMATVGIGMASQVFESFARRLTRGIGKKIGGKVGGGIGDAVGGIAMSFASTYALGHLAAIYYESGRRVEFERLRALYTPLRDEGKELALKYGTQIAARSQSLTGANVADLLKSMP